MPLLLLPGELLLDIAFHVVASTPLGPPAALIPLLLTCRTLHTVLAGRPTLNARIFRLKFDAGAIARRAFTPRTQDLAEQLIHCCEMLQVLKQGDVLAPLAAPNLFTAYMLMLDNDGKNYAQLEWAGIRGYVDRYVRQKLWAGREKNDGWPIDSAENACALWLYWMTLDRDNLRDMPVTDRDALLTLILPYALLGHRYPAAEAPANHFDLPLRTPNPHQQTPMHGYTSNDATYPHYFTPSRAMSQVHFGARPDFSPPLISVAAKLVYLAIREINPIRIPPNGLPMGLTVDDYAELNAGKAAEIVRGARWDWDQGLARGVTYPDEVIVEGDEESRKWDPEWWRRILCWDIWAPRPKYTPGHVYIPGCMSGAWQGRFYMPRAETLESIFYHHPAYPGYPSANPHALFTEQSLTLIMFPVFFNIQEHHRICHCPLETPGGGSHRCGMIPLPGPSRSVPEFMKQAMGMAAQPPPAPAPAAHALPPANNAAQPTAPQTTLPYAGVPFPDTPSLSSDVFEMPIDLSMANAWMPGHIIPSVRHTSRPVEERDAFGRRTGRRRRDEVVFEIVGELGGGGEGLEMGRGRGFRGGGCVSDGERARVDDDAADPDPDVHEHDASSSSGSTTPSAPHQPIPPPSTQPPTPARPSIYQYLYETYSPHASSSHDAAKCLRCADWARARREQSRLAAEEARAEMAARERGAEEKPMQGMMRKRTEEEMERVLERYMKGVGRGPAVGMEGVEADGQEEDERMRIEPFDVSGMGFEDDNEEDEDEEEYTGPVDILGDDQPDGFPALYDDDGNMFAEQTRRVFDKARVGVEDGCGGGVRDIVITGETQDVVWHPHKYTLYGRVRPWDGLIGFLRVDHKLHEPGAPLSHIFVCGYLVGKDNFVGEWRMAASDPLRPGWSGPFLMSRRREGR